MVARLRRKIAVWPAQGSGSLSSDGKVTSHIYDDGKRLINPDGPQAAALLTTLAARNEQLEAHLAEARADGARLLEALTPSNNTKHCYIGEFHFDVMVNGPDEDDDDMVPMEVHVPWPTIKQIMAAIRIRALTPGCEHQTGPSGDVT